MPEFHPLYNFIPVSDPTATVSYEQIASGTSDQPIRHDMWQQGAYSGRLIVEIHLDTPTVVGGQQEPSEQPNGPSIIKPYYRDGKPAIPSNSLRGMIGSVVEILSQSALRILKDKTYSVRKPIDSGLSLSAIGMLKTSKNGTTQFELLPLTIPVQAAQTREQGYQLDPLWQSVFSDGRTELKYCLPAYIEGYEKVGDSDNARQQMVSDSFLGRNPQLECFFGVKTREKTPEFYYARLVDDLTQRVSDPIAFHQEALKTRDSNNWHFLLGQKISQRDGIEDIITTTQFNQLTDLEKTRYTKGILRILGIAGREQEIPHTKKGLFLIDRLQRYSLEGLDSPRYHHVLRGTATLQSPPLWEKLYPQEAQVLVQATTNLLDRSFYTDNTLINQATLNILQTVDNPDSLQPNTPVNSPLLVEQQNTPELETFAWFEENDKPDRQAALPIIEAGKELPTLTQWTKR